MDIELLVVRIFVRDWDRAVAFYRDLFQRPPEYSDDDMGWAQFTFSGYDFGIERATDDGNHLVGRFLGISLWVNHFHDAHAELRQRGIAFDGEPELQHWGGMLAHFSDPDGNILTLAGRPANIEAEGSG